MTLLAPWGKGWLAGTDAGEWGGALYIAESGRRHMIGRGPVLGGFTWNGSLHVIFGLRHLGDSTGEIPRIDLATRRVTQRIMLPAYPDDIRVSAKASLIVRTKQGDIEIDRAGKVGQASPEQERRN